MAVDRDSKRLQESSGEVLCMCTCGPGFLIGHAPSMNYSRIYLAEIRSIRNRCELDLQAKGLKQN